MEIPDMHSISDDEAEQLCEQLRQRMIQTVSETGGHLASSLGVVELTVAIHRVFDTKKDRLIFDVGHQCYCHKILTGRDEQMETLRSFGGLSGFPNPDESEHDAFIAGHASTSASVALGMARARTAAKEDYSVIAVMGDGAMTGGLLFEGLSNAGESKEPVIFILNDNGMSITKNVGGMAKQINRQRMKPYYRAWKSFTKGLLEKIPGGGWVYNWLHRTKTALKYVILPGSVFEGLGITYLGPFDGHDVGNLTSLLKYCKSLDGPVLLHIRTTKGKGYKPAEENPDVFHGVSPFCVEDGTLIKESKPDFSGIFGAELCELAQQDQRVCAITAAMQSGTGLQEFADRFPNRFFDVGIAESHATVMAAGMAKQGMIPVFAVYSSFLQRAYDMILHDVAIQGLHVVFAVDRAGLVGEDGVTHQGIFDVSYLNSIPGMTVLCPSSFSELRSMLRRAVLEVDGPVAVRYPKGGEDGWQEDHSEGESVILREGANLTLLSYGILIPDLLRVAEKLSEDGIQAEVLKLNCISSIDFETISRSVKKTGKLMVVEECVEMNCVGQRTLAGLSERRILLQNSTLVNLGSGFVTHGSVKRLRESYGLDDESLYKKAREVCAVG